MSPSRLLLLAAVAAALQSPQPGPSKAQATAEAAIAAAVTPADCVKAIRPYTSTRQQELRPTASSPADYIRQVDAEKTALAKKCADRFDMKSVAERDLAALADLYSQAAQPDLAKAALDRALASKGLTPADRAVAIGFAVPTIVREPKSVERNLRLDRLVDELDANPAATLEQKLSAHSAVASQSRSEDNDAGILKHGQWMVDAVPQLTPDDRKRWSGVMMQNTAHLAEALASRGLHEQALTLLDRTKAGWAAEAARLVEFYIDATRAKVALVGTPAPALTAPRWLNMPAGTTKLELNGSVTLLEFSAWWCGPCKRSYPGVKRLLAKYAPQGFRFVLATQLYGYFEAEGMPGRTLAGDIEFERDREYFKKEGLEVPIAVGDRPAAATTNAEGVRTIPRDANDLNYKVGGIPQIHLIDKRGVIRLVMIGYDEANEARLSAMIESLLKEQ
jgi:hypothetical protein